ncbi:MAG: HAD family phosphatase [Verrucomicrobiales bacterium]|nr:HAD family phosphatase [Verrucomicrobiales bacterium]
MVNAYLFDIGNVIIAFDFMKAARKIESLSNCPAEEILARVSTLTDTLEMGKITPEQFYDRTIKMIDYQGDRDFLSASFEDIFELNGPMVEFIEARHAEGIPLHLLSNTNGIHVPFFEKTFEVFDCFDGRIYSHEAGCMKPDPEIYQIVKRTLPLDPATTLYIDDLPANCEAGREAGFLTAQYDLGNHEAFLRDFCPVHNDNVN